MNSVTINRRSSRKQPPKSSRSQQKLSQKSQLNNLKDREKALKVEIRRLEKSRTDAAKAGDLRKIQAMAEQLRPALAALALVQQDLRELGLEVQLQDWVTEAQSDPEE